MAMINVMFVLFFFFFFYGLCGFLFGKSTFIILLPKEKTLCFILFLKVQIQIEFVHSFVQK